ncbi:alginate export family protein [Magnetospirillum fulvum]|nr:alginate export family protein [Magnetospirillum fulvum]
MSVVLGCSAVPAVADVSLYEQGGLKVDGAFTGGLSLFTSPGAQFGAGSNTAGSGTARRISGRPSWSELFLHPELKASLTTETAGTFYGDVSGQLTATGGDGDASLYSTTYGHPVLLDIENAYAGWRSGKTLTSLGLEEDALDLSGGRQSFRVGDGFLISNGVNNAGKRGGWWNQSRSAFAQTGIVKASHGPVRGDIFYLQNDSSQQKVQVNLDQAKAKIVGANIEVFGNADQVEGGPARNGATTYGDRKWYAGLTYFNVVNASNDGPFSFGSTSVRSGGTSNYTVTNTVTSNREGMNVLSLHLGGNFIPAVPDFSLYGNYVYESNSRSNSKVDASAWYIEPGYQLSDVLWTPKLSYRYAHFSGDSNPDDDKKTAYDPFFYNSVSRGYGTWFMGEIVGNYIISNSNVNVHMLNFSVNPRDDLKLSVLGYLYNYDKKNQYSNGTATMTSDSLAREIDFVAEWTITENVSLSGAFAAAQSGGGYRQYQKTQGFSGNDDKTWLLGETSVIVKF